MRQDPSQKHHTCGRDEKTLPYLLINHNADGALGDIPDNTGAAMVELVRHSLMHGTVHLDVHIVANLVVAKVRGQVDVSFMPERTREQIPGPRSQPMTGRHDCYLVSIFFSFSSYCTFLRSRSRRPSCKSAQRGRQSARKGAYSVTQRVPFGYYWPWDNGSDGKSSRIT